ncbi:uncharacterized protein BDZ99DRAFT_576810 [Mytilinidion resinicola]|uniref:Uncharacterized protein n=1 Tax=Mytilinidion resinicola TaxID=574789 RepID=A0A6A6Y0T2_9PEZI|nr:uncharacterized protein BDZ99DRAFT_576810 [Mytilinidion resinicola]KAF2802426.1 hypothetical protein BDZ99DRAFT_576810 [Mytilinidion resinicola]
MDPVASYLHLLLSQEARGLEKTCTTAAEQMPQAPPLSITDSLTPSDATSTLPPLLRLPLELRRDIYSHLYPFQPFHPPNPGNPTEDARTIGQSFTAADFASRDSTQLQVLPWGFPSAGRITDPSDPVRWLYQSAAEKALQDSTKALRRAHRAAIVQLYPWRMYASGLGILHANRQLRAEAQDYLFRGTQPRITLQPAGMPRIWWRYADESLYWAPLAAHSMAGLQPAALLTRLHVKLDAIPALLDYRPVSGHRAYVLGMRVQVWKLCKALQKMEVLGELAVDAGGLHACQTTTRHSQQPHCSRNVRKTFWDRKRVGLGREGGGVPYTWTRTDENRMAALAGSNVVVKWFQRQKLRASPLALSDFDLMLQPFAMLKNVQKGYIAFMCTDDADVWSDRYRLYRARYAYSEYCPECLEALVRLRSTFEAHVGSPHLGRPDAPQVGH